MRANPSPSPSPEAETDEVVDASVPSSGQITLRYLAESVGIWADGVFGRRWGPAVTHFLREVEELRRAAYPTVSGSVTGLDTVRLADEIADCALVLMHLAWMAGIDLEDACLIKFEVCRAREWAAPDAHGVIEHVRVDPAGSEAGGSEAAAPSPCVPDPCSVSHDPMALRLYLKHRGEAASLRLCRRCGAVYWEAPSAVEVAINGGSDAVFAFGVPPSEGGGTGGQERIVLGAGTWDAGEIGPLG